MTTTASKIKTVIKSVRGTRITDVFGSVSDPKLSVVKTANTRNDWGVVYCSTLVVSKTTRREALEVAKLIVSSGVHRIDQMRDVANEK